MQITFRKNTLAVAALLAIGGSAFAQTAVVAPASVTIYGRLDVALEANTNGSTNRTAIQNFASRLGFKGEKAFSPDLKGIFQIETGFAPDDTTQSKSLASRNSFVGMSSASMGTGLVGTYDMPLKALEGTGAPMWGEGDLQELIIHGKASKVAIGSSFANVHTRQTNVLNYTSPKFADIVAKLAYSPDELSPAAVAASPAVGTTAAIAAVPAYSKPMVGASLYWDNGMFNAGYAYQSQDNNIAPTATVSGKAMTGNKATFGAKMSNWTAGLTISTLDNNNGKKTDNWTVAGTYTIGQTTLKASYGASSESSSGAADDLTAVAIEADYAMDKDFTIYTYYTQMNNGTKAKGSFTGADNFVATVSGGDVPKALGLGIRYNF